MKALVKYKKGIGNLEISFNNVPSLIADLSFILYFFLVSASILSIV